MKGDGEGHPFDTVRDLHMSFCVNRGCLITFVSERETVIHDSVDGESIV